MKQATIERQREVRRSMSDSVRNESYAQVIREYSYGVTIQVTNIVFTTNGLLVVNRDLRNTIRRFYG